MSYNEYVEFCLKTYKESLEQCDIVDLKAIVVGNIDKVYKTYLTTGGIEDFIDDVYLDVLEKI